MALRPLVTLTLGALAALTAGAVTGLGGGRSMDVDDFHRQIVACIPVDAHPGLLDEAEERCAREVLVTFTSEHQPRDVHAALASLYQTNQPFTSVCHNISHYAGVLFAQRDGASAGDLPDIASDICVTGVLHGYLETVGLSGPDDATVDSHIEACEALRQSLRVGCADGIGHMLYLRDPDPTRSAARCESFDPINERIQCSYGVIMFAGQVLPDAYPDRPGITALPIGALPDLCANWPVKGAVGQYGCGMGLANLLVFPTSAQRNVAELAAGGRSIKDDDPLARDVVSALNAIYAACMELRSVAARLGCLNDSARNMSRTHEYQFADFDAACDRLPEGYEIACPDRHNPASMHAAETHLQVEEDLGKSSEGNGT